LVDAIDEFHRSDTPERCAARARAQILSLAQTLLRAHPDLGPLAEQVAEGRCDPYSAAEQLFAIGVEPSQTGKANDANK
jgi:LAO/AO transport system kinase